MATAILYQKCPVCEGEGKLFNKKLDLYKKISTLHKPCHVCKGKGVILMSGGVIEKLEIVDEILASYESWMHGEDGENCTKARKILIEVKNEL